eukprot:Selendium_serpulae@DN2769_c0_g1_i3.p1
MGHRHVRAARWSGVARMPSILRGFLRHDKRTQHYPAADHEPAKSALAKLLATTHDPSSPPPESSSHPLSSSSSSSSPDDSSISRIASKLLIGNGASELVDLLVRLTDQPKC